MVHTNIPSIPAEKGTKMLDNTTYKIQDSPVYNFLTGEWVSLSAKLDSIEVDEKDFVLYVLWLIDSLRDSKSRPELLKSPWTVVRMAIRSHLRRQGYTNVKYDLDSLTDAVCGCALYCWGLVLTDAANESQTNRESFMTLEHNLGEHWKNVQNILNSIQFELLLDLRQWMISYVNGEIFYTSSDAVKWDDEAVITKDLCVVSRESLPSNKPLNMNVTCETLKIDGGAQIGIVVEKVNQ